MSERTASSAERENLMSIPLIQSMKRAAGYGSVHDVPQLAAGFTDVFESYLVPAGDLTLHAVIGGQGAPLLLLGGWPQNWFAWRHLMLPLARSFTVIAVDPRGVGLSDKPATGFDSKTLAADMFALMDALGFERFAMAGHDIGMWTGFAMAYDQPGRIDRIALGEALIPGVSDSPPLLPDERWLSDFLWHFNFNRAREVNERLVEGRESIYFGHQFATKAGSPDAVPAYARAFYIEQLRRDPNALRASFDYYRAIDESIPQNRERARSAKLTLPVLAFAGELACGGSVEAELRTVADNVQSVIIAGSGHYPAEEKPEAMLEALQAFFAPYADGEHDAMLYL
ncbi:Soluble epoxide hydrolase [compost metagenome]